MIGFTFSTEIKTINMISKIILLLPIGNGLNSLIAYGYAFE